MGVVYTSKLIKPDLKAVYPEIAFGRGVYLQDSTGKRYLDGCSGAVSSGIGHGVAEINRAIGQQLDSVAFVYRSQFTSPAAEELAERLSGLIPGASYHAFFVNSGSEATETAAKIAVQYWQERGRGQKVRILSRWMSYHGFTLGALSMSGHARRRSRYASLLHDWPVVSSPYPYRSPYGPDLATIAEKHADELEQSILRIGADNIAAFIAEPVIGASGGAIVPPDGYFQRIRDICTRYDVLLIVDEVMTGIGRTGELLAINHWHVIPDLITLGKGLGAGYTPIGATLVREEVLHEIQNRSGVIIGGHTFSANPLSCATARAVFDYVDRNHLVERAAENGEYLLNRLRELTHRFSFVGDARGLGLLCGIEFVENTVTKKPFPVDVDVTGLVVRTAFEHGLLLYPAGGALENQSGDAVIVAPPLTISRLELEELLEKTFATLSHVQSYLNVNA